MLDSHNYDKRGYVFFLGIRPKFLVFAPIFERKSTLYLNMNSFCNLSFKRLIKDMRSFTNYEVGRWSKNVCTLSQRSYHRNVNAGGYVVKKSQNLVNVVC